MQALEGMPSSTAIELRDKALLAFVILTGHEMGR